MKIRKEERKRHKQEKIRTLINWKQKREHKSENISE
jgi:hypothetical protein